MVVILMGVAAPVSIVLTIGHQAEVDLFLVLQGSLPWFDHHR